MRPKIPLFAALLLFSCAFGWFKKENKERATPQQTLQHDDLSAGYALLFNLLSDEKNVSKLLIVKHDNRALHDLIKEISTVSGDAHKTLEKYGKTAGLNLQAQQLPPVELAVRESISKEKAKQLLATKGDEFQSRLLLTQNEALTYGRHLALVLAGAPGCDNKEFLESLAAYFSDLQNRVMKMLQTS